MFAIRYGTRARSPKPRRDWAEWRPRRRPKRPPVTPPRDAVQRRHPRNVRRPAAAQHARALRSARPRSQKWPIASGGGVVRHMVAAPNGQRRGADFFVQIAGESFLIDDRRQCFLARGLEFTRDRFADRAVKLACSAVMRQELQFGLVVPERGADLLCIALGMAITSYAELAAEGIEEAAHAVLFASDRKASAVRVEVGLAVRPTGSSALRHGEVLGLHASAAVFDCGVRT